MTSKLLADIKSDTPAKQGAKIAHPRLFYVLFLGIVGDDNRLCLF